MRQKSQHSFGLLFTTSIAPHFPLSFSPSCAEKHQSPVSPPGHMPLSGVHLIPCSAVRKFQRWIKYSMPPPSPSALPYSTFLCFLGLLFDVKSDSNIYSSVNQKRFSACFSPILCTNLILFPEMPYQSKEKNLFLSLFYSCFIWKGEMQNALMRPVSWNGGSAWLTLFVENMISLWACSHRQSMLCVLFALYFSLFLFYLSIPFCMFVDIRSQKPFECEDRCISGIGLWACLVGEVNTGINICWEAWQLSSLKLSEIYTQPLKED